MPELAAFTRRAWICLTLLSLLLLSDIGAVNGCNIIRRVKSIFKTTKVHTGKLVGCYPDRPHSRDLPTLGKRSTEMTLQFCLDTCGAWGTKYLGLQGGNACWCGQSYGNHGKKLPDSQCNLPCNGQAETLCGGPMQNSVYEIS